MKCEFPIRLKNPSVESMSFEMLAPCGHCLHCSIRRQQAWTLRICLEASQSGPSAFVTLTYDEATRPERLEYAHIQQFMRRLRKNSPNSIRFFCVGEYGKQSGREHWHVILFNTPSLEKGASHIEQWPHGGVFIGDVTRQSAAYTARYSLKSGKQGSQYVMGCSRRPGIGVRAFELIGEYCARAQPVLDRAPAAWRLGRTFHSLDRTSREAWLRGYLSQGGTVKHMERTALSLDMEARLQTIIGDPLNSSHHVRIAAFDRKDAEHGSL